MAYMKAQHGNHPLFPQWEREFKEGYDSNRLRHAMEHETRMAELQYQEAYRRELEAQARVQSAKLLAEPEWPFDDWGVSSGIAPKGGTL